MMYMWNGFSMISKRPELTEGMMQTLVEAECTLLESPGNTVSSRDITQDIMYLKYYIRQNEPFSWCLLCPLQKMSILWMTAVWSTCWRVCVWRTRGSSRLLRNALTKCVPGECHLKGGWVIPFSHSKTLHKPCTENRSVSGSIDLTMCYVQITYCAV